MGTAKPLIDFTKFRGIKNLGDATTTPVPFLREALNVDIDNDGMVSRRGGHGAALIAGNYHSGFTTQDGQLWLAVTGTSLVIINPDFTTQVLRSDLVPGLRMQYVEVNGDVYYTNNQVYGFVRDHAGGVFPSGSRRLTSTMVAGHLIEFFNGRIYVFRGGTVLCTPVLDFGRLERRRGFAAVFPGRGTMLKAVADGLYIGYGTRTVFAQGGRPKDFVYRTVADSSVIPYSAVAFNAELVAGDQPLTGKAVWWASETGPCIGFAGGTVVNLGLNKYDPPAGTGGASIQRVNRKGTNQILTIVQG